MNTTMGCGFGMIVGSTIGISVETLVHFTIVGNLASLWSGCILFVVGYLLEKHSRIR